MRKILGERIEKRRQELNMSQADVYRAVGVCRRTYELYTKHNTPIPSDKLLRFSEILNCTLDYLFGKKEYTQIVVEDKMGVPVAIINDKEAIEYENYKIVLS